MPQSTIYLRLYDFTTSSRIDEMMFTYYCRNMVVVLAMLAIGTIFQTDHASAQSEAQEQSKDYVSGIYTEAFAFESDQAGKGRVDIYVQIPYEEITFFKEEDHYIGRIEISVSVTTSEKQQVWQKNQMTELRVKDFAQTTSSHLSTLKQFSSDLPPGTYELLVQVTDQESKKTAKLERPIKVKDFRLDSLALSDLMLVYRVTNKDSIHKNIVPNLMSNLGQGPEGFYLFFEVYNTIQLDSIQLFCKFINTKHEIDLQRMKNEVISGNRTQIIWKIDTPGLAADRFLLSVEAVGYSKSHPKVLLHGSSSRTCFVRIKDLPVTITDIDKAAEQLRYIATQSEIDNIRDAPTPAEKQKRFLEFWAKRNPNPQTTYNALMEEYYSRIAYANKSFTGYLEGWKTDMGMVFIQFGPPQNIERHPFDSNSKPYEIWYYYEQNREFIFVDESGFGDYHLQYPTTDLWGRIR